MRPGRALITTSTDGNAAIWHGKLLTPLSSAFHLGESVLKSAFSPDGRRFACATDSSVIVGDVEARALLGPLARERQWLLDAPDKLQLLLHQDALAAAVAAALALTVGATAWQRRHAMWS